MSERNLPARAGLEPHIGYWLRFVSNQVSLAFSRRLEERGVTVAEWVVLRVLADAGPLNPSELAGRLAMTRSAISKLADRLVAKDLLDRRQERGDRRFQTLRLTATGAALVPRLVALAERNEEEFFGHLPASQRRSLHAVLQGLVEHHGLHRVPTE